MNVVIALLFLKYRKFAVLVFATICFSCRAYAIDVGPGAYVPAPAGTNIALLYLGSGESTRYEPRHGDAVTDGVKLKNDFSLLRLFHMFDVGDLRSQIQLGVPYVSSDVTFGGNHVGDASGFADPFVAYTVWPINDAANKRYLGVSGYLYLPVGGYDFKDSVNPGANRYVTALQLGYSETWGSWRVDVNSDVTWYDDNDEYTASKKTFKQDETYNIQPWVSYTFANKVTTSVGLSKSWGGRSTIDGIDSGRATDSLRARFAASYWIKKNLQVAAEVGRDLEVEGGYRFDYTGYVRLGYVF